MNVPVAPGLSDVALVPDNAPFAKQSSSSVIPVPGPEFSKQASSTSIDASARSDPAAAGPHFSAADFKFLKVLGKGSFGKVCGSTPGIFLMRVGHVG